MRCDALYQQNGGDRVDDEEHPHRMRFGRIRQFGNVADFSFPRQLALPLDKENRNSSPRTVGIAHSPFGNNCTIGLEAEPHFISSSQIIKCGSQGISAIIAWTADPPWVSIKVT